MGIATYMARVARECPQPPADVAHPQTRPDPAVWVGKHLVIRYFAGGSFYNRGRQHVPARLSVRWIGDTLRDRDPRRPWETPEGQEAIARAREALKPGGVERLVETKAEWQAVVAAVDAIDCEIEAGLPAWAEASARRAAKADLVRQQEAAARQRERSVEKAAPRLLAALERLLDVATTYRVGDADTAEARALIAELNGG